MILLLSTSLVALRVKNPLLVLVFFLGTQALWVAILFHYSILGVNENHGYKLLLDLFAGVFFYAYAHIYLKYFSKKTQEKKQKNINFLTKILSAFLAVYIFFAGIMFYHGVKKGHEIINTQAHKSAVR